VKIELRSPESSEPNLEEAVPDISLDIIVNELEEEQTRISEEISKFMSKMSEGGEGNRKCSKCDDLLNADNFIDHYKIHQDDVVSTLRSINQQKKTSNAVLDVSEASSQLMVEAKTEVVSGVLDNVTNIKDLEAEQTRLSKQVLLCMEVFEKGAKETSCTECSQPIVKEELIEHFRIHVTQISEKISELGGVEKSNKKKPGPKSRTMGGEMKNKSRILNLRVEGVDDPDAIEVKTGSENIVVKENLMAPKMKGKPRKKKSGDALPSNEHVAMDEYTCFNPTFKIKPGTKKVGNGKARTKSKSNLAISVPVPEIKLSFNLDDLGFAAQEINLQDLSSVTPQADKKRKGKSGDFPGVKRVKVETVKKIMEKEKDTTGLSKKRRNKASKEVLTEDVKVKHGSHASLSVEHDRSSSSSSVFSLLPPTASCSSFPNFLRAACSQAETLIPSGMAKEQEDLGRRVVHRLAGQRVMEGGEHEVTKDDVMREMMGGNDDYEVDQVNISSDGSEAPLVMDLDQEL